MKLSHLTNKTLLADVKILVAQELRSTLSILHHLNEIDKRKLYSDLKYSSLYSYCIKELGYSEAAAHRRIVSARLINKMPEIAPKIETGVLSLTNIAQVVQTTKNSDEQKKILKEVEGLSKNECVQKIFEITGEVLPENDSKKRISKDQIKVSVILSDETVALMDRVRALSGKEMDSDKFIREAMHALLEKIEKQKFKQTKSRFSPPPAEVKRSVVASVKRNVYARDKKCVICGSFKNLQYDHRKPFSLGGISEIENIRLLCSQCNQRSRIRAGLSGRVIRV